MTSAKVATGARLQGADLSRSQFGRAFLDNCDLREAKLSACDLTRVSLQGARLGGVQWNGADLRGANLRGAREMTPEHFSQIRNDASTTLPNGSPGPYLRHSGAEKPARPGK